MKRASLLALAMAGLALVTACGDDDPVATNSGDQLTEAELQQIAPELFQILGGVLGGDFSGGGAPLTAPGTSAAVVPFSQNVDMTAPCEGGGTASVTGSVSGDVDDQTNAATMDLNATQTLDSCLVMGDAVAVTVSTAPPLEITAHLESDGDSSISVSSTTEGGLSFLTDDGREGTCYLNFTSDVSVTSQSASYSVNGEICGVSVDNSFIFGDQAS